MYPLLIVGLVRHALDSGKLGFNRLGFVHRNLKIGVDLGGRGGTSLDDCEVFDLWIEKACSRVLALHQVPSIFSGRLRHAFHRVE